MKSLLLAFILLSSILYAEPIDDATFSQVMAIADREGVPRSVANWLMVEESGNRFTGERGCATAVNKREPGGWPSVGLYQPYMKPSNITTLLDKYWYRRGEVESFDPLNPIHSAKVGLRYIADLHRQLSTWYRAACAYNAGPANVRSGAVDSEPRFAKTRDYALRIILARNP